MAFCCVCVNTWTDRTLANDMVVEWLVESWTCSESGIHLKFFDYVVKNHNESIYPCMFLWVFLLLHEGDPFYGLREWGARVPWDYSNEKVFHVNGFLLLAFHAYVP